jgi:hypothetical protein
LQQTRFKSARAIAATIAICSRYDFVCLMGRLKPDRPLTQINAGKALMGLS